MLVQMELARIIISEINDQQVIFLREIEGEREFPLRLRSDQGMNCVTTW